MYIIVENYIRLSVPGREGPTSTNEGLRFLVFPDPFQSPRTEGVTTVESVSPLEGQTLLGSK